MTPLYAPALVAWVGGGGFSVSFSFGNAAAIGWFPLGPREPYFPSYNVSSDYFGRVNSTNTVINSVTINNYYSNSRSPDGSAFNNIRYANRDVRNAVTAVPQERFSDGRRVSDSARAVSAAQLGNTRFAAAPAVAPQRASVLGPKAGEASRAPRPPDAVLNRPVVARTAPPAAPAAFERQQVELNRNPGRPLPAATVQQMGRDAPARKSQVRVEDMNRVQRVQPSVGGAPQQGSRVANPGQPQTAAPQPADNNRQNPADRQNNRPAPQVARPDPAPQPVAAPAPANNNRQNPADRQNNRPAPQVARPDPAPQPVAAPAPANNNRQNPADRQNNRPAPQVAQPDPAPQPAAAPAPANNNRQNPADRQNNRPAPQAARPDPAPQPAAAPAPANNNRQNPADRQNNRPAPQAARPDPAPQPVATPAQQPVAAPAPANNNRQNPADRQNNRPARQAARPDPAPQPAAAPAQQEKPAPAAKPEPKGRSKQAADKPDKNDEKK